MTRFTFLYSIVVTFSMDLVGDDFFEKNALFFLHLNIFQMYNFQ